MQRIWSVDMPAHVGERVVLEGWLSRLRRLHSITFLILRDGQGLAQIIVKEPEPLASVPPESVLRVRGEVVAAPQAPRRVEVVAECVEVIEPALEPPPFELHRPLIPAQLPTLLDHAALSLRHASQRDLWRLAAESVAGFRRVLRAEGFTEVFTPKLVSTATEGGANVFKVDYFGRDAYLAQSPQLYKQILVAVFERVFEVGPVFRAEPHDTPRHLNQYTSLDAEMGFIENHRTVMALVERVIRGMSPSPRAPARFPEIHFTEAQALLRSEEPDLSPADERWLCEWALREHDSEFLFVTGFPMSKRPFYTHPDPERPEYSNSFDLLFRGLELVTGGQRLHRYQDYMAALEQRGMSTAGLEGYLEAFRHGMPPHGGFALGLERWVARLADVPNVRQTALFPRDLHRLTP